MRAQEDNMRDEKGRFRKGFKPWNIGLKGKYKTGRVNFVAFGKNNPWFGKHPSAETRLKMRLAKLGKPGNRKGQKNSEEHRRKLSLALKGRISFNKGKFMPWLSGKNHWAWKGGITELNHKIRTCTKYLEWQKQCLIRDNWICQKCFKRGGDLEVNHKKTFSAIISSNNIATLEQALACKELWKLDNGETLCKDCHELLPTTNRRARNDYGRFIGFYGGI